MSLLPVSEVEKPRSGAGTYSSRLARVRQLAGIFLAVTTGTAAFPAHGAGAYLPAVGPPALRFEPTLANSAAFAPNWFARNPQPVKDTAVPSPAANAVTNADPVVETVAPPATNVNEVITATTTASPEKNPDVPDAKTLTSYSFTGSLDVTPQMLAEFLQPVVSGTNQTETAVFVPVDVGFKPPTAPTGESRAIYKSE